MPILITIIAIIIGTVLDEIETGLVFGLIAGVASLQWLLRTKLRQQQDLFKSALTGYARIQSDRPVSTASPEKSEAEVTKPITQTTMAAEIPPEVVRTVTEPKPEPSPKLKPPKSQNTQTHQKQHQNEQQTHHNKYYDTQK